MKEMYTIGEIGKLFQINVQTLQYYDKIGIFSPEKRNPENGYRQYKFDQVYALAAIRYLRTLGYSLEQIKQYMESRDIYHTLDLLKQQSKILRNKADELLEMEAAIQRRIEFVEEEVCHIDTGAVLQKYYDERDFLIFGQEELFYRQEIFYLYPTVVFYEGKDKRFGVLLHNGAGDLLHITAAGGYPQVYTVLPGQFLYGYHVGEYKTLSSSVTRIREKGVEKKLSLAKITINYNIIDQFVEQDGNRYITEIQIPILETPEQRKTYQQKIP